MRFPSMLRRLRNTQGGGTRSTAGSGSTPYTPEPSTLRVTVFGTPRTVSVGDTVKFTASVSNAPAGVALSYTWAFGDDASPATGSGATASCTYSTTGVKTVRLTVSYTADGKTVEASDTVIITVESQPLIVPPLPPVARAGMNQVVAFGSEVSFSGADSTSPSGGSLTYSWDFGADANPPTSNAVMPFCTYRKPGTKTVTLTVTDEVTELTDSDDVTIKVKPLPVAEAGDDQIVGKGQKVSFDGSGSTGIGIDYLWDFGDEKNPTASSDEIMPSYRYNTTGTKTVTLTVTDRETGVTAKDDVTIKVKPLPVARAGDDQTVAVGDTVSFNGLASTSTNLSYSWVFGADAAPLTGSGATPSCTYNEPGAKTVMLTVTDRETGLRAKDDVTINVGVVARAGSDQTVAVGDTVSFDGSGSIGTNLSYSWVFGADAAPLTGSGATPSCTYNEPGAKIVTLTVMNTVTKVTDSDDVTINVGVVARAGSNQIVAVNTAVSFDGSDSVGTNLSYSWTFGDETNPTADSDEIMPSYTYTTTGVKMVTLTVTEGEGEQSRSNTDTLTVTVTSIEPRGVNSVEKQALIYTFGTDVGEELAGLIEIRFNENVVTGRIPHYVDFDGDGVKEMNDRRIEFNTTHNTGSVFWLGNFIHEATHIWQRNTGLHRGRADGDYNYTLDQLLSLDLNLEEHALAVEVWFVSNYAYTNGLIGDGPGQLSTGYVWGGTLQSILGYSPAVIGGMPDSEKIRVINFYHKRLINEIRDSTRLPFTETEDC